MYKLKFRNPIGTQNPDFTVAVPGQVWAERAGANKDKFIIELVDEASDESLGTGEVFGCYVGPIHNVPAMLLEAIHDPVQRSWSGLYAVLQAVYSDEDWNFETVITVMQIKYLGSVLQVDKPELILPS